MFMTVNNSTCSKDCWCHNPASTTWMCCCSVASLGCFFCLQLSLTLLIQKTTISMVPHDTTLPHWCFNDQVSLQLRYVLCKSLWVQCCAYSMVRLHGNKSITVVGKVNSTNFMAFFCVFNISFKSEDTQYFKLYQIPPELRIWNWLHGD